MERIKINGVWFIGRYAKAYYRLVEGYSVTHKNFKNGSWEATSKMKRFIELLENADINFNNIGDNSLRSCELVLPLFVYVAKNSNYQGGWTYKCLEE